MKQLEYQVSFTTPAFLGNAQQQAQWRTPPFKALIRQWWRVAAARRHSYKHHGLRESEGDLFGNAWLEPINGRSRYRKSRVALRLEPWGTGQMSSAEWPGGPMESVITTQDGKGQVRSDVYLGFGPVLPPSRKENRPSITIRGAIGLDQKAHLRLFPYESEEIGNTLQLMAWFGTLGSRSRNGWGSLFLESIGDTPLLTSIPTAQDKLLQDISRQWTDCFGLDWPHALGAQGGTPLVWVSEPLQDWRKAMGCLANVRVEVRRRAKKFADVSRIGGIHLLGYPAGGRWELPELDKGRPDRNDPEGRLASQIRFKVCRTQNGFVPMVYHLPHRFPDALRNRLARQQQDWLNSNEKLVWQELHETLDHMTRLKRLGVVQ